MNKDSEMIEGRTTKHEDFEKANNIPAGTQYIYCVESERNGEKGLELLSAMKVENTETLIFALLAREPSIALNILKIAMHSIESIAAEFDRDNAQVH